MLKPYYKNTQSVSTEFARSYYVPFGESDKQSYDRDDSSRFTSLCGMWKIAAYDSIQDVSDDFYLTDGEKDIPVPSCVQYFGYDFFQYTNTRFPFPFDPPHIPSSVLPSLRASVKAPAMPLRLSPARSAIVFLRPGRIIMAAPAASLGLSV